MRMALGAKKKYGFATGRMKKLEENAEDYEDWEKADFMVQSWLLNSIEKHMSDNFLYVSTAQELWETLKRRYEGSNGVMIYDLEKKITNMSWGNQSIADYFTRLLWDELQSLQPPLVCTSEVNVKLDNYEQHQIVNLKTMKLF